MTTAARPIRLFAPDIDDAMLGDPAAARRFLETWEALPAELRPLLVYNSDRSVGEMLWLVMERRLPPAEFIIGGIGTEIYDPVDGHAAEEFRAGITVRWDPDAVGRLVDAIPGVRRQPAEFTHPRKLGWYWPAATARDLARLEIQLEQAGFEVTVGYSGQIHLDLIPRRAGKGNALAWLCRRIDVPLDQVLVAGAGGNNGSVFALPGVRGLLLGHAGRDLFAAASQFHPWVARAAGAHGLLEGLGHFGVLQPEGAPAGVASLG